MPTEHLVVITIIVITLRFIEFRREVYPVFGSHTIHLCLREVAASTPTLGNRRATFVSTRQPLKHRTERTRAIWGRAAIERKHLVPGLFREIWKLD